MCFICTTFPYLTNLLNISSYTLPVCLTSLSSVSYAASAAIYKLDLNKEYKYMMLLFDVHFPRLSVSKNMYSLKHEFTIVSLVCDHLSSYCMAFSKIGPLGRFFLKVEMSVRLSVRLFTFEVPFKHLFAPSS